jgi:hypothetical protein
MDLNVKFANGQQRDFYYATARNQVFSGGFNNGKTFGGCLKATTLLLTFNGYRMIIAREKYTDLRRTTMQTFFKGFPGDLIESHNDQVGFTGLKNKSCIFWIHLDNVDENTLRGLEVNSALTDQAEETEEKVFDVLDARIGRWDGVTIPENLLNQYPNWPKNPISGNYVAPSYNMLLVNPDTQYHYIYRKGHPDSIERLTDWAWIDGEWDANLGSRESYEAALKHDPEWVNKYVRGIWGRSEAQVHYIDPSSIIEPQEALLAKIKEKGNLFRSMDHGDSAPTCCLWFCSLDGVYICYREYYVPSRVISYHRQSITDLSKDERYSANYADPQIFKKTAQKDGGFWTVSDEYKTKDVDAPPLYWLPADNNEFATRNRINELLRPSARFKHPITGESPAPGIYFIKGTNDYPNGCKEAIKQLGAARRKLLGTIDGKSVYSDDRDENIPDHAYDPTRYFVAMHGAQPRNARKSPPRRSFAYLNSLLVKSRHEMIQPGSSAL